MNSGIDLTFTELRSKDIINSTDGKRLGRACDIVFDSVSGKIKGIVAPYGKKPYFGKGQDIFIPFSCIQKFGDDVILVDVDCNNLKNDKIPPPPPPVPPPVPPQNCPPQPQNPPPLCPQRPNCDMRCEKCMLFDCAYRWKNN